MKTNNHYRAGLILKSVVVLSLCWFAALTISSCGKNKATDASASQEAQKSTTVPVPDTAYSYVDDLPVFTGGDTALLSYVAKNTVYPKEASQKGIHGKVIVKFVVNKDCTVGNIEILKGVDTLLDAEAIRVVSMLPKFEKAGVFHGRKVATYFMIPISFTLN